MTSTPGFINLYTTRAHVFQINTETKTSWNSMSDSAIPISLVLPQNSNTSPNHKRELKIIGATDDGELAIDCTISWDTLFNKRSQKFIQWPDLTELRQKALANTPPRQASNWDAQQPHQQIMNLSETNGRTSSNPGRVSNANSSTQYTNTSGYAGNNSMNEQSIVSNGDNVRHQPRSHSTASIHTVKSSEGNGITGTAGQVSPDPDEHKSISDKFKEQLKYENNKLKQALEESSKSAALWQSELLNLRTNNVKLTQALQESKAHVEEWEKELLSLRDENKDLRQRLMALESTGGGGDPSKGEEYKIELQKYKNYVESMQGELSKKDDEVENLQRSIEQLELKAKSSKHTGDSNSDILNNNYSDFKQKLDILNAKFESKANELVGVQRELADILEKIQQ